MYLLLFILDLQTVSCKTLIKTMEQFKNGSKILLKISSEGQQRIGLALLLVHE